MPQSTSIGRPGEKAARNSRALIAPISRDERRLMQKAIHKTHDKNYALRWSAMLIIDFTV
ncbi:hypothetical protein FQF29_26410 [Escherichia coli]|nr:hypothetical protein [Escherichia coli]